MQIHLLGLLLGLLLGQPLVLECSLPWLLAWLLPWRQESNGKQINPANSEEITEIN